MQLNLRTAYIANLVLCCLVLSAIVGVAACPVPAHAAQYAPALPPPPPPGKAPGLQTRLVSTANGTRTFVLVFAKGDEIMSGLTDFASRAHLHGAHFTGIGAVRSATLAWFDPQKHEYLEIPVPHQAEVLSLIGDIAIAKSKPAVHAHMVVGYPDGTAHGGHLLHGIVWPTLEVFVTDSPTVLPKQKDPETGLDFIKPGGL